jgi:hypothetical protein
VLDLDPELPATVRELYPAVLDADPRLCRLDDPECEACQ